jgi:hypothetical protein
MAFGPSVGHVSNFPVFLLFRIGDDGVSILGHEISFATLLAA